MSSMSRWTTLSAAALAALLAFGTPASALAPNKCGSKKISCVGKKMAALLKCHNKAEKSGVAVDPNCITKAETKFDGGADPTKGCFEKLEPGDPACLTLDDTASMESKVDAFVLDVVRELAAGFPPPILNACSAGKKKCVTNKAKALLKCYEKAVKKGLAVDPACLQKAKTKFDGGADPSKGCFAKIEATKPPCPSTNNTSVFEEKIDAFVADAVCALIPLAPTGACPTTIQAAAIGGLVDLDSGWTGQSHDAQAPAMGRLTLAVSGCANANHPCGTCNVSGPLPNAGGAAFNNQRCVGDTSIQCTADGDCGANGPCRFFFGSPLPLSSGGVSVCVTNEITSSVTGTLDPDAGTSQALVSLLSRVHIGPTTAKPCPNCVGGFCDSGPRVTLLCTTNGESPLFGNVSFDCPPDPGGNVANLNIPLNYATGVQTVSLTAASPPCTAPGFGTSKCFCDTCNNGAATACSSNADCVAVGATICGGRRCQGGANAGAACTVPSECPGGACGRPGKTTLPNECDDVICTPNTPPDNDSSNEGLCLAGPFELFCAIETFRGCVSDVDCTKPGDSCTNGKFRQCMTDNGVIGTHCFGGGNAAEPCTTIADCPDPTPPAFCGGGSVSVSGAAYPACAITGSGTGSVGAFFCIGPTSSSSVNSVAGLPGLGRVTLPTTYTFN